MSLDDLTTDAVYDTMVADDAVYIDGSGEEIAVRVIPVREPADLLPAAEIGINGVLHAYRIRKASLDRRPQQGEQLIHAGQRYCVLSTAEDFNPAEWLIRVDL